MSAVAVAGNGGGAGAAPGPSHCAAPAAGQPWPTARPGDVGLDEAKVQRAIQFAAVHQSATLQVFRFGCLAASGPLDPVFGHAERNMWSHTKTVVALLVGRAQALGRLRLDDTVGKYFPEADPAHAAITVRHLLTQTSGLHLEWSVEANPLVVDRVKLALSLPVDHRPGTYFDYHQTAVTLLAALVERAVGRDLQSFAQDELFGPIGIARDSWFWLRDGAGHTEGWSQWFSEPDDNLARLGTLMLDGGVWDGRRLIDESYLRELSMPSPANPGYGFLVWVNAGERYRTIGIPNRVLREHRLIRSAPADMFFAWGFHGQHTFVIPSLRMVITRTEQAHDAGSLEPDGRASPGDSYEAYHEFFRLLMAAVTDRVVPDPGPWSEKFADHDGGVDPDMFLHQPLLALGGAAAGNPHLP
jgi:CubicO group peptidase (beta-lactamase class C family)